MVAQLVGMKWGCARAGASGVRLKEACNINKSLSTLGNVIKVIRHTYLRPSLAIDLVCGFLARIYEASNHFQARWHLRHNSEAS